MYKFCRHSLLIGIIGIILCIVLFATNIVYKLIMPLIEKSGLDGVAFVILDTLVFILPLLLIIPLVIYIIAGHIYIQRYLENAEARASRKLLKENGAKQVVLDDRIDFLKHKYYSNCPNCGSVRVEGERECSFCGTSLVIKKED